MDVKRKVSAPLPSGRESIQVLTKGKVFQHAVVKPIPIVEFKSICLFYFTREFDLFEFKENRMVNIICLYMKIYAEYLRERYIR